MLMFEVLHVCTCTGMKMSVFQPSHSVHHSRSLESRDSSNEEELLSSREGSGQQHQNGLHLKQNQDSDSSSDMIVSSVIFYINFRPRPTAHKKKLYASMLFFFFFKAHTDFHKYIESKGTSFIQINDRHPLIRDCHYFQKMGIYSSKQATGKGRKDLTEKRNSISILQLLSAPIQKHALLNIDFSNVYLVIERVDIFK